MSLATLSEQEIQQRMKLGLVTNAPGAPASDDEEVEEWEDIEDAGKEASDGNSSDEDYVFDPKRRSSVSLDNMSINSHDSESDLRSADGIGAVGFSYQDHEPNKRLRARQPSVASIREEPGVEDEDVATVDGDDAEDMEHGLSIVSRSLLQLFCSSV